LIVVALCSFSTLGEAWAQLKKSLADEAEVHLKFSSKVNSSSFCKDFCPVIDLSAVLVGINKLVNKLIETLFILPPQITV